MQAASQPTPRLHAAGEPFGIPAAESIAAGCGPSRARPAARPSAALQERGTTPPARPDRLRVAGAVKPVADAAVGKVEPWHPSKNLVQCPCFYAWQYSRFRLLAVVLPKLVQ